MRSTSIRPARPVDLRRLIEGLSAIPLRPTSARVTLDARPNDVVDPRDSDASADQLVTEVDPGWVLARSIVGIEPVSSLKIVADRSWWRIESDSAHEAVDRLWRHGVAVSIAARRLARDAGDPDPNLVGRAGLLHRLGLWAIATVDPDRLVDWLAAERPERRRDLERLWLGTDAASFGRTLAGRWGLESIVADAAWLHGDTTEDLIECAENRQRLAYIRQAHAFAEQSPWALGGPPNREPGPLDARVRLLMAEVQTRCSLPFIELDATPREERLSRETASLRMESARLKSERVAWERLSRTMAESSPEDRPETWAERAGLAWCDLPNVAAARVVWDDSTSATEEAVVPTVAPPRPPTTVISLGPAARPSAEVQLWTLDAIGPQPEVSVWSAWAGLVADRWRLRRKLDAAVEAYRRRAESEEATRRTAKLDALAEFAAGAGHELNNPLAVILGRAQLLLARETNPDATKALRAIIVQAQRAHRILRDLMYIARTPESRPRLCSADEILRTCLRDAQPEADARGIRLVGDTRAGLPSVKVWADPDSLRHIADILIRNALEATPAGGSIVVGSSVDDRMVRWTVKDSGRGISAHEATHLFDPFFCGRQAGRGLGLGLPRAARIIERAGGELTWQSTPGQGTSFQLKFPVSPPPTPEIEMTTSTRPDRAKSA